MSAHTAYTAPPHSLLVRTSFILLFTISTLESFSCCFNISLTEYNAKKNVAWEFQDQTSFPIFFSQKWEFKNLKVLMLHFWAYFLQKILFHIFSAINITIYVSPPLCLQARVYLNYSYYLCVHRKESSSRTPLVSKAHVSLSNNFHFYKNTQSMEALDIQSLSPFILQAANLILLFPLFYLATSSAEICSSPSQAHLGKELL